MPLSNTNHALNKNLKTFLILIIFFTIIQANNFLTTLQKSNNKMSHYLNGNIKLTNIKVAHFNKGNSKFETKLDNIHYIIDTHKPLIFSISQPNYCNINKTIIDGYNIVIYDFKIQYHTSRKILLIHNSLSYTRHTDLEKPHLALILCDIKLNKTDKLTIAAYYRQ